MTANFTLYIRLLVHIAQLGGALKSHMRGRECNSRAEVITLEVSVRAGTIRGQELFEKILYNTRQGVSIIYK